MSWYRCGKCGEKKDTAWKITGDGFIRSSLPREKKMAGEEKRQRLQRPIRNSPAPAEDVFPRLGTVRLWIHFVKIPVQHDKTLGARVRFSFFEKFITRGRVF